MKYKISICVLVVLCFAAAAAAAQVASHAPTVVAGSAAQATAAQIPADKPVARVNGSVLTYADLVREEYSIFPYARQHNGLPKDMEPQIRAGAMKMIVFEELVYQEAVRRKMTVPPAKMRRAEADFRKQFATPGEFNALMQGEFHGSEALFQEKVRRSLLIEAFLKNEVELKSAVSSAEVRAYYDKNAVRFQHPESFTIQTISVLPPAKPSGDPLKDERTRADEALRQAKATKTPVEFGLLAERISEDDYRVVMGQHKPIPADQLAPQVVKALRTMKPGDVSDVIQVEQAFTIVRLGEHTPAGEAKFEDVKDQLGTELERNKTNQIRAALDKMLRQNAKIQEL